MNTSKVVLAKTNIKIRVCLDEKNNITYRDTLNSKGLSLMGINSIILY